jgi:hypothetical protein
VVAHRIASTVHPSRARTRSAKAMRKIQKRLFMGPTYEAGPGSESAREAIRRHPLG